MSRIREKLKSVRFKLFLIMCIVIIFIVCCLIIINSIVLGSFYAYSKVVTVINVYNKINDYYANVNSNMNLEEELRNIAFKNNFDIAIQTDNNIILYYTDKDFITAIDTVMNMNQMEESNEPNVIYRDSNMVIRKIAGSNSSMSYMLLSGELVNSYKLYIRIPIAPIEESVRISNSVLVFIGCITIIVSGIIASVISKKFTDPILELNGITNKMAKLDFSQKYRIKDTDDEINELGKNINTMSNKLETVINQLRDNNIELEKDIEEKSKIDEMRKQFISDVSHELKTPIALIQGYAEGLVENVTTDDESRKFYAEVILDESNKMDKLVKQLLELMKLEYGKREFNNEKFDLRELVNEVIRKCDVMIKEKGIKVNFNVKEPIYVFADEFYIDQVVTNYFTNAIKHAEEVNGRKEINIYIEKIKNKKNIRVYVYNTGENIKEEDLERIWKRFYKVDSSRNREDGGTGIGLALVKAIMNNYQNEYGVHNKEDGVEFYFDLDIEEE